MNDIDELSVLYEDLACDVQFLKQAYGGLSFPKPAHNAIRKIGYQTNYRVQVPLIGPDYFILDTMTHINGSFELTIFDMCGSRLWQGTWRDAA